MEGRYDILRGGEAIGQADINREGLYYRFSCRCRLSGEVICRLKVTWEDKEENLGILIPDGNGFSLNVRIPVSRVGKGKPVFHVLPRHGKPDDRFIPISPETPFQYLHRLQDAYLQVREGQPGIVLKDEKDPLH